MAGLRRVGHVRGEGEPPAGGVGEGGAMEGEGQVGHRGEIAADVELGRLALPAPQHTPVQVTTTHGFTNFFFTLRKERLS